MSRRLAGFLAAMAIASGAAAEQAATYRAAGDAARLFDQYDNDGYSLAVSPGPEGSLLLAVRVSDAPLSSRAPFPTRVDRDPSLPLAADRDALVARLVSRAAAQAEAVERVLVGLAELVRYDPDRVRRQDPAAVFSARRGNCVGLSELAVDLLRRAGIRARTVQGVLRSEPGTGGYEPEIGGSYHRWIEVHYPDRGFVFSDPSASVNGVDARYVPFGRRAYAKPRGLKLTSVSISGDLAYGIVRAGEVALRLRAAAP